MKFLLDAFKKARWFVALLAGYVLFAAVVAILVVALFVDSGILANPTTLQLLTVIGAMIFLLRMDVAVSNEDLQVQVKTETTTITASVQAAAQRIEDNQQRISEAVRLQSDKVELMRATLQQGGRLFSLEEALRDLKARLDRLDQGDHVTIEHLGLDVTNAWDDIVPILEPLAAKLGCEYRLLMLGGESEGDPPLPTQVREWIKAALGQRKTIRRKLDQIKRTAKGAGGFDGKIHTYRDLPVVHGFRVHGAADVAYVTLSRWAGNDADDTDGFDDFYWGGKQYHRVLDTSPTSERDLLDIFTGYFQHWWRAAEVNERATGAPAPAAPPAPDQG